LNSHGKLYRVSDDSSKTFYSVRATWFDDSDTKVGEMSDEEETINDDNDNDYESGCGYESDIGVFTHAEKFRDIRVEEHKNHRTEPGPLKKDDTGGEESGEEDNAVKKGQVSKAPQRKQRGRARAVLMNSARQKYKAEEGEVIDTCYTIK